MANMTVWYKIDHPEFPQCADPMVVVTDLDELTAERVARSFYGELKFILGDDINAVVWAE